LEKTKNIKSGIVLAALVAIAFLCTLKINHQVKASGPNITVTLNGVSFGYDYNIVGEIKNVGDTPATNVTVIINGYHGTTLVGSTPTYFLYTGPYRVGWGPNNNTFVLLPGERISFYASLSQTMSIDHCTSSVSFIDAPTLPAELKIVVTKPTVEYGDVTFEGNVTNLGGSPADFIVIYATCYNATGAVLGSGQGDANNGNVLNPGENATWTISYGNRIPWGFNASQIATYAVTAQAFNYSGGLWSDTALYTDTAEATGPVTVIPEFPTAIFILPFLIAIPLVVIYQKKRRSSDKA
jgi:hypothetical protein